MKTTYTCEKCGKTFEDWRECSACEESHVNTFEMEQEYNPHLTYKEGNAFPDEVIVRNSQYKYTENGHETVYCYAMYKLVGQLTKKQTAEQEKHRLEREAEAERQWMEYKERERQREEAQKAEQEAV